MTKEQKNFLLKDLCGRLPYGVKCAIKNSDAYHYENVAKIGEITIDKLKGFDGKYFNIYHDDPLDWDWFVNEVSVEDIKPYLFPFSSMTNEQKEDMIKSSCGIGLNKNIFDWYNKNHFDYRGLIPMGLALDATGLNIY